MSNPQIIPGHRVRKIIETDPDVKECPKRVVEMMRIASEQYVHFIFGKCREEANKKKKGRTINIENFNTVVQNDPALSPFLKPFFGSQEPEAEDADQAENEMEDQLEEEEQNLHQEENNDEEEELNIDKISSSEEEQEKSEQPSISQSEISDLEPDDM